MNIILTCFEPFGGSPENASAEAVKLLPSRIGYAEITKIVLPVEYGRSADILFDALERVKPAAVICTGMAAGRKAVTPEYVAVNVRDSAHPDNGGRICLREPVIADAPNALYTNLPTDGMMKAIRAKDIPAALSFDAGTYVCNDLFYLLMHRIYTTQSTVFGGFIHIPAKSALPYELSASALEAAVGALI